ncbi:MAG: hypothetical protein H6599_07215 [Flavobacteriales bacterium]|nr:hypothetical protein [Flavobacteriales bacterium]
MKLAKRILIVLGVLVAIIGTAFIIFHDDADVEQIEKEQQADIDETVPEKFDELNSSFEE